MPDQPRWRDHLLLVCSVAVGLIFGVSGLQKLFYLDVPAGEFAVWGYPRWLLFAVGAAELLGALLLQ
ncbi:MAG: DoxX family protein, partial [Chromatiales bacterium]|nr:DoxX family protein [Chromatiales bacterium]